MQKTEKIQDARAKSFYLVSNKYAQAILDKIRVTPELLKKEEMRLTIQKMLKSDRFLEKLQEDISDDDQDRIQF